MNKRSLFTVDTARSLVLKVSRYVLICGLLAASSLHVTSPAYAETRYETGIATSGTLLWMNNTDLDNRLSDIEHLGATWIRVDFSWPTIQPDNAHDYTWELYDRIAREASLHHLKILAVLGYTPKWAQETRCATLAKNETSAEKCNPRNNEEFGHFAGMVSFRYKTVVRCWEIWNEPNLSAYWKTAQGDHIVSADPYAYASLANAAASQIRDHAPDSVIITGGLAPMFEPQYPKGMRQSDYLAQLLPLLKRELFDGVGIHPYTWPVLPNKAAVYNAFYTVDNGKPIYNLRTIMKNAGWGDKEIWGTEFGASTIGVSSGRPTRQKRPDHVTENVEAQIIQQGIGDWYAKSNVGPLFVHSDSDQWLPKAKNEGGFGMRRIDGTKKPAYTAFQTAVQNIEYKNQGQ